MNESIAQCLWRFVVSEIMAPTSVTGPDLELEGYSLDGDLPEDLNDRLTQYFHSNDRQLAIQVATVIARKFYLASFMPDEHLMLVAHLLKDSAIDQDEACALVQVDHSNFALMSNDAKNIVMLAEVMTEEQHLGLLAVGVGDVLAKELNHYLETRGS